MLTIRVKIHHVLSFLMLSILSGSWDAHAVEPLRVNGSSTVYPVSAGIASLWNDAHPTKPVEAAFSGTTAGMRMLLARDIFISGASRPIREKELTQAKANGFDVHEFPIAFDGITVAVSKQNTFIDYLTIEELKTLWKPGSPIKLWSELRSGWPAEPVALFGAGRDSGTFEFFSEALFGKKGVREDAVGSEDDVQLVQGLLTNKNALGYFGYAYFVENQAMLRAIPIQTTSKAILPSEQSIKDGTYQPFSRPIFVYVNAPAATERAIIVEFMDFYLKHLETVVPKVGYISLGTEANTLVHARWTARIKGSIFSEAAPGVDVLATLKAAAPAASMGMQATVETMRDESLDLARTILDDRSNAAEVSRRLKRLQQHLDTLMAGGAGETPLGELR